ncbi:MAG: GNAT family N-acetyltransferase [Acidimicrobiaceae bacterium]|jgi:RimJ/RimL family protein N-acetyltransferase|nr:GNAT family N-acetyltransferase [Acidimicrobiaceae bacterium]
MTPVIRTERLLLREWREADKLPYSLLNGDAEVMRHFPSTLSRVQSDEMVDRMAAGWEQRGFGLWAAERIDTHLLIGFVGLSVPGYEVDGVTPCVEVGWRLAKQHWGQGFAPEAARAALAYGFEHVDLPDDEIVSFTTTKNLNSQRVMQKVGMRLDPSREFDHPLTPGWHGQRHVLYCIDRAAWRAGVAR